MPPYRPSIGSYSCIRGLEYAIRLYGIMRKLYISPPILPHLTKPIWKERPQPELSNDRSYNMFQCILQKLFKKSRYPSQCEQTQFSFSFFRCIILEIINNHSENEGASPWQENYSKQ